MTTKYHKIRVYPVFLLDKTGRGIFRLFRVCKYNSGIDGKGFSETLSFAISKRLFKIHRRAGFVPLDIAIAILFLRIHYKRSYGGPSV